MSTQHQDLLKNIKKIEHNPLEIAKSLKTLIETHGYTQKELAQELGKDRSTITNYLRILTLPEPIQESIHKGLITLGHAKALLQLPSSQEQSKLHEKILRHKLTVRDTEAAAKKNIPVQTDVFLHHLEEKIQHRLGTKVSLKKSQMVIHYYSLEDLDRILELMGINSGC